MVWIDADAVIVDDREDIAGALEPDTQLALVRHRREDVLIPNTGVMAWRAGEFARGLLDRMWASTRFLDHPWWENAALLDALGYDFPRFNRLDRVLRRRFRAAQPLPGVQFLPGEWNWSYLDRSENPRIVHCLGVPVEQRLRDMQARHRRHVRASRARWPPCSRDRQRYASRGSRRHPRNSSSTSSVGPGTPPSPGRPSPPGLSMRASWSTTTPAGLYPAAEQLPVGAARLGGVVAVDEHEVDRLGPALAEVLAALDVPADGGAAALAHRPFDDAA